MKADVQRGPTRGESAALSEFRSHNLMDEFRISTVLACMRRSAQRGSRDGLSIKLRQDKWLSGSGNPSDVVSYYGDRSDT